MSKDQVAKEPIEAEDDDDAGEEERGEKKEPIVRARKGDPFADAFEKAEAEVDGEAKPATPKKAKADKKAADEAADEADADADADAGKQAKAKPPAKKEAKPGAKDKAKEKAEEDGAEDDGDADAAEAEDDGDGEAKPEQKKAAAQPLAAKAYWPKERREAFSYQPREVQEAWLAEAPVPHTHWPDDQKTAFAALPREAQEVVLVQAQEIERGYTEKFQALANERKLAEGIKKAIPANLRKTMQERGLDELGVFSTLLGYQQHAMQDPAGYVRKFIAMNRIDPRTLFAAPQPAGNGGEGQPPAAHNGAGPQADITSHPVLRALMAEHHALKEAVLNDRRQREQEDDRRRSDDLSKVLAEKDEEGNSRYPYIRLLADPMAWIIESDSERYGSMSVPEQIADAYRQALQQFPELIPPPKPQAKPAPPVDEPEDEDEDADAEREAEAEKLKKASTKKSKTPQTAPSHSGDPFARAFSRAERQIGHR